MLAGGQTEGGAVAGVRLTTPQASGSWRIRVLAGDRVSGRRAAAVAVLLSGAALAVLRSGVLNQRGALIGWDIQVRAATPTAREVPLPVRLGLQALAELGQRAVTVTVLVVLVGLVARRSRSRRPALVTAAALVGSGGWSRC